MKKNWKKNLIATAVLITVCGGIYLNWHFGKNETSVDLTEQLDAQKVMSDELLVLNDGSVDVDGDHVTTVSDYFAAVRLSRQQARDNAVTNLQEAMAYGDDVQVSTSSAQLEQIVQTALSEAQIESLVIAKGYADCVAYMSEDGISVAVAAPEGGLQESDIALIADIVMTQAKLDMTQIRVVSV